MKRPSQSYMSGGVYPRGAASVWLVNLFFGEGVAPTGFLLESLAVKLQEQGWLVEVLTGQVGYNAAQTGVRQRFSGKVVHLGNRLISAAGFGGRLFSWLALYASVAWFAFTHPLPSHVVIMTTPPYLHLLFVVRNLLTWRKAELILWNQDTYPEVLPSVGLVRANSIIYRLLVRLDRWATARIDKTIVLDQAMRDILANHGARHIRVIPNWELDLPKPAELSNQELAACVAAAKETARCLILYTGNYGWGHDLNNACEYLRRHSEQKSLFFLFVGGGEKWPQLLELHRQLPSAAVAVFPYQPKADLPALINHADLGLVAMEQSCLGLMSPSKIHGYLLQGKPLLYLGQPGSNVDDAITGYQCGFRVDEKDYPAFEQLLDGLAGGRIALDKLAANAKRAAVDRYVEKVGVAEVAAYIQGDVG